MAFCPFLCLCGPAGLRCLGFNSGERAIAIQPTQRSGQPSHSALMGGTDLLAAPPAPDGTRRSRWLASDGDDARGSLTAGFRAVSRFAHILSPAILSLTTAARPFPAAASAHLPAAIDKWPCGPVAPLSHICAAPGVLPGPLAGPSSPKTASGWPRPVIAAARNHKVPTSNPRPRSKPSARPLYIEV